MLPGSRREILKHSRQQQTESARIKAFNRGKETQIPRAHRQMGLSEAQRVHRKPKSGLTLTAGVYWVFAVVFLT